MSRKEDSMINKDSKQELDEVVVQAALQQTESQKQAQALAPGAVQQQDKPSFSMCLLSMTTGWKD